MVGEQSEPLSVPTGKCAQEVGLEISAFINLCTLVLFPTGWFSQKGHGTSKEIGLGGGVL